jgi:hypothetical protein
MSIIPFLSTSSFDPEITNVLVAAFDHAWERIENSGSPLATGAAATATREKLAKHIIALAKAGERDEKRLIEGALALLAFDPARRRPRT